MEAGNAESTEDGFVAALRALKAEANMSVRALSITAAIPASTLGGYFSGRHLPEDADVFERLLRVLGVSDQETIRCWQSTAASLVRARRGRRAD